jgi:hypothetical protein
MELREDHFNEEGKEPPRLPLKDPHEPFELLKGEILLKTYDLISKLESPQGSWPSPSSPHLALD